MDSLGILPTPVSARRAPGAPFAVVPGVRVVVGEEPDAVGVAVLAAGRIGDLLHEPVAVVHTDDGSPGALVLRLVAPPGAGPAELRDALTAIGLDRGLPLDLAREAYRITATPDRVELLAVTAAGLVRGAVSLLQMVVADAAPWLQIPCATVVDHPRLPWRGVLVDVSEVPLSVTDAQVLVSVMATLKLNVLHVRSADGTAWLPDLMEDGHPVPGGFAELQVHAAGRHIAVVPEVDVVGGAVPPSRTAEVLGRVAATTRAQVVHVGGRHLDGDPAAPAGRDVLARAVEDVAAAGAAVMAWQSAAAVLGCGRPPRHLLQVHDVTDPAVAAAAARGAGLVLSPPGLDLAGSATLRERHERDPRAEALAAGLPASAVHGLEAVLGDAHDGTRAGLFGLLLPAVTAVAEQAWSGAGASSWESFSERVAAERVRWGHDALYAPAPAEG